MVVTGSKGEEEKVERGKVAENEEPEFGEERNRAGWVKKKKKKWKRAGVEDGAADKRGGEQTRGKIKEEEMAGLQRSSGFKSGPPFYGDRPLREGLGETVSEKG